MRGTGTAADERQRINLTVIPGLTGDLLIYKAALVLFRPQADRQTTTIYNSGPPQDSSHFYKMPRDLPSRRASGCMGGDLSAVVASPSRRPQTSMCLVKVGSRPAQIATQAFQSTPRFASIPSPVIRYLINDFGKIVGYLTLSPQAHALVANLLSLNPPSSKLSGTCPLCLSTKATEGNHP